MPRSVEGVLHEFKNGQLHSGSKNGPVVKSRAQAIAIGLSENDLSSKKYSHLHGSGKFNLKNIYKGYKVYY